MSNSESNQEFKTGDTVQLKSGGPIMTVVRYEDKEVYCQWFVGEYDKVNWANFVPGTLRLVVKNK